MASGYGHTGDKGACSTLILIMHVLYGFKRFSGRWGGRASDRLDYGSRYKADPESLPRNPC